LGYGYSHVSRVESGDRWPPPDLPDRADRLLRTGGELATLWPLVERERQRGAADAVAVAPSTVPGPDAAEALARLLRAYLDVATRLGGRDVVVSVEHHTRMVVQWQAGAAGPAADKLLGLAADFAHLAGWARFDGADYATAMFWYSAGTQWATLAGDRGRAARLLARQSAVHWAVGNAGGAIALAEAARRADGDAGGELGWASLAEARGHALAGNERACGQRIEEAFAAASDGGPDTGPATAELTESVVALASGTCYRDLAAHTGRPAFAVRAVDDIARSLADVPAASAHSRAVVSTRLASAYCWAGRPEEAVATVAGVLAAGVGSARVRAELRTVHARLTRLKPRPPGLAELTARLRVLPPT
jgi:hypothetical protein